MYFKLTEEQILEIIELYGGSKGLITKIETKLNSIDVILDDEDYYNLIAAIVSQKETNKEKVKSLTTKIEKINVFIPLDEIIITELNRKYNNFEDAKEEVKQKVKSFSESKKRHI